MTDRFKEILDLEKMAKTPMPDDFVIGDITVTSNPHSDPFQKQAWHKICPIIELLLQAEEAMRDFCSKVDGGEARSTKSYSKFADTLQAIDKFRKGEK